MPPKHNGPNRTLDILSSIGDQAFLGSEVMQNLRDHGLRVDRIAIALIRPDAAQPRRVLPETIHRAFHNQEITPVQALKQYIEKVRIISRQKGRPFESLLDLLVVGEEDEGSTQLTALEQDLRDLTNLAVTLRQDGQVNPLTIVDCSQGAVPSYIIETGERRYWANYMDMEFIPGYQGDGTIPCIILRLGESSVFRQAKENTSRAGLNAIGMARQAALLLLTIHDIYPPRGHVSHDFYREALDLDLRGKREYTADVLAAMGGISLVHFSRHKKLLQLEDEALEMADRYNIEEARLRYVVDMPLEQQAEIIRQIIDFGLSTRQVKDLCDQKFDDVPKSDKSDTSPKTRRAVKVFCSNNKPSGEEVARILLEEEGDVHLARIRMESILNTFLVAQRYLEENENITLR
ncbi:MAG: hypothetical protein K8L91_26035 [Anaerolineae bacterium]|nr:hypothetical protein [Anaerolineae bacterium]